MTGIDVRKVVDAYLDQWALTREWCDGVSDWSAPSVVEGWTLRELMAHFGLVADSVRAASETMSDEKPLRLGEYLDTYRLGADGIDAKTREWASGDGFLFAVDASAVQAEQALDEVDGNPVV